MEENNDLSKEAAKDVVEVFEYYKSVFKTRVRLTPLKKQKIATRLKSFSKEELFKAIDNLSKSPFHNGVNDRGRCYNQIEFVFRNDDKTEEWVNKFNRPENATTRMFGDALIENYAIAYKRYMGAEIHIGAEEEQTFYACAKQLLDYGINQYHAPQAIMLAFFLLDWRSDKSVSGFVQRMPWLMVVSPVCKERALSFTRDLMKRRGETSLPSTTEEAVRLLEKVGLTYD
jgi:hypothetical protein